MAHDEHHHPSDKSLGEKNKEHFNNVAEDTFNIPWIADLFNHIAEELQQNVEWIGIEKTSSKKSTEPKKMLDYACGNGLASRSLGSLFDSIRGMDISSKMVELYNKKAQDQGFSVEKRRAIQADLLNPEATPSPEADSLDFSGFHLIAMLMALHHVEDYAKMVQKLSERLKEGGILLIVDWVTPSESGCSLSKNAEEFSNHTITRLGFAENEVETAYETAGLKGWSWRWTTKRVKMPEEVGGEQQLFMARGEKVSNL